MSLTSLYNALLLSSYVIVTGKAGRVWGWPSRGALKVLIDLLLVPVTAVHCPPCRYLIGQLLPGFRSCPVRLY